MKHLLIILIALVSLCCNTNAQYQVNLISSTNNSITVRSVGYAKNKKEALAAAEVAAVKAVLFQGIDDAPNKTALISTTEETARKQHKDFFKDFFDGKYRDFISSSEIVQPFSKDINKRKNIVADITIKVRALRENLEKNGVIRKFGL